MSHGPLCPNLSQKVQKEVSQVVLDIGWPIAPPKCFGMGNKLAHDLA